MKDNITVTIGIPAYNEELNIRRLISAVLKQRGTKFTIKEIIVIVDGCTDNTEPEIRSIKDSRIKIITHQTRHGQTVSQNMIFREATGDVVVMLEADVLPSSIDYLSSLLTPLFEKNKPEFIQGNGIPLAGKTLIGKSVAAQFLSYHAEVLRDPVRKEGYVSGRGGRAFTKQVYSRLRWPAAVPEDVYALLWCKVHHIKTYVNENALCFYQSSETIRDFCAARTKMGAGASALFTYFPEKLVKKAYEVPQALKSRAARNFLLNSPLLFIVYIYLKIYLRLQKKRSRFNDFWQPGQSTKILNRA